LVGLSLAAGLGGMGIGQILIIVKHLSQKGREGLIII
jgi:hypothetical protein